MNATPPEAKNEYSRGQAPSEGVSGAPAGPLRTVVPRGASAIRVAVLGAGLGGALLLLGAEFTTLFVVRSAASTTPVDTVSTGSHHSYALIPVALLALALTYGASLTRSRPALLALGVLGVIALLIALLGDLPDAQATGLLGSATTRYATASSSPSTGLYLETLGAVALIISSGLGLILLEQPAQKPPRGHRASRTRSVS
jgi:hypothetical protein